MSFQPKRVPSWLLMVLALAASLRGAAAPAQGFAAIASPARFELAGQPGATLRAVLELTNAAAQTGHYAIKTADWDFDRDHNVVFEDKLAASSCRPWVAIERRELNLAAGARLRYRFEIAIPAGIPPRECRFALLIEGRDPASGSAGPVEFPVSGRLGVIVYVAVGEARAELTLTASGLVTEQGRPLPAVTVRNSGLAHGRLAGFLDGRDAQGTRFTLIPQALPILPGQVRTVPMRPERNDGTAGGPVYPLQVEGQLESGAHRLPFSHRYAP